MLLFNLHISCFVDIFLCNIIVFDVCMNYQRIIVLIDFFNFTVFLASQTMIHVIILCSYRVCSFIFIYGFLKIALSIFRFGIIFSILNNSCWILFTIGNKSFFRIRNKTVLSLHSGHLCRSIRWCFQGGSFLRQL